MRASDPKHLDAIERIQNLPYGHQLRWAANPDNPWEGMRLPETKIDRGQVNVIAGNVTRMPELGGRPCFGNPIAWAVHGRAEFQRTRSGFQPTRCGRCKARPGCERVSEERLSITPEIREADAEFRTAGGLRSLRSTNPQTAQRALRRLRDLLDAHGEFTSANDEFAQNWVPAERDRIRTQATERKRKERAIAAARALRGRQIPDILLEHLERERQHRAIRYRQYRAVGLAPMMIKNDPKEENDRFTADVWLARERLAIMRKPTTAYGIATEMNDRDHAYGLSHESLRDRVRKALKRIEHLEQADMPGSSEPVWPRFDAKATLSDLTATPPYGEAGEADI